MLATASPAASPSPRIGSTPAPGASTTSPASTRPVSATGTSIRPATACGSSRRQRTSGPTAMIANSASATGPAALLKKGGPIEICSPNAPAATIG